MNISFKQYFEEQIILERGFSRIAQIMSGSVPSVKTFAIITYENPMSQRLSIQENKQRNEILEQKLIDGGYGFNKIDGDYGTKENPFFIRNISLEDAKKLGFNSYANQESILFGVINKENDITFYLYYYDDRPPLIRHVWRKTDTDKFYSEFKGRKFYIPFFDKPIEVVNY